MKIEPIELNDEVVALLAGEELSVSDLRDSNKTQLFGARIGAHLIGTVGVELHQNVGLLRSLVVDDAYRKAGHGQALVSWAEAWASEKHIEALYLLTTTATEFFSRLGYKVIPRSGAPASIASTHQFADLCPSSAVFMCKVLAANN